MERGIGRGEDERVDARGLGQGGQRAGEKGHLRKESGSRITHAKEDWGRGE